jgi:cytochrome b561
MQPVSNNATKYDTVTILFHWLIALLVVVQFIGAQTIDWFPSGPLRIEARSFHIAGGLTLTAVLVLNFLWRRSAGRQLPPPGNRVLTFLANAVQGLLSLLILAQVLVGIVLASTRADAVFSYFTIPSPTAGNKALAEQILQVHGGIALAILVLAGIHAFAALAHYFLWNDGVLDRVRFRARKNVIAL